MEMYPDGGIAKFNYMVRTNIKNIVLKEVSQRHCPIPYRDALVATSPLTYALVSFTNGCSPVNSQVVFLSGAITCSFAIGPLLLAMCMRCAQSCATQLESGHGFRLRARRFCSAAAISVVFEVCNHAAASLPGSVAADKISFPTLDPVSGVGLILGLSLLFWLACIYFYWPRHERTHAVSVDPAPAVDPAL